MHTQYIPLKDLHVSPLNMRAEKKEPSLKRMAVIANNLLPTIREKGILQDLIVRPNNDGFEILAGRRRYYAARVIESERSSFDPIKCNVMDEADAASGIEVSLIENMAREDADELSTFETFSALIREGRNVGEIARTFGKTEREVTQCLAIANLLPRIRELYRTEDLDSGDLQLLTMATKTQQREWLHLWDDNNAPTGHDLKGWLFGGKAVATKVALFDLQTYPGKIVGDLFSEDGFFASADEFWNAQDQAVAARRDAYLAAQWAEVVILERGQHFPTWDFTKATKKAGGRVYIEPTHTGEVRFHEGYVTQREATKAKKRKPSKDAANETSEDHETAPHSPITKTMRNYLDLHRHAAVRLAVIARPKDGLRLLLAHAISASGNWTVKPDVRRADNQAIKDSATTSDAQTLFDAEAKKMRALLAPAFKAFPKDEGDDLTSISGRAHYDADLTVAVFQRLLKLKDAEVTRIAAFVMAETLAVGSAAVDAFGAYAKIDARKHWMPDATFFELMRDRASVNAMLAEVAGKKDADKLVSAKLKDQKAAFASAASESRTWCPGWMRFPATDV